tara:strand:- start:253 stop:2367 length:2115 start_codon:yes stop_codon:yes gene_type:complete
MAVYWLDPFLEATTQGNGTTDTSTKDGSYAAPFSLNDFWSNSNVSFETINGTTLSDGDEVRFKGLPFSTLFESKGNVYYSETLFYSPVKGTLKPITGNSSFDATVSTSKSSVFAFQNSDISSYLPNWSHPLFFASTDESDSSNLYNGLNVFLWGVFKEQLGYTSASSTGMELFRLKDTYANPLSMGTTYSYWFSMTNEVKLTAGWTSTTAQDGYSIVDCYTETNYRYLYTNYRSTTKTHFDLERCIFSYAPRSSSGKRNNLTFYGSYYSGTNTLDHTLFTYTSGMMRGSTFYFDDKVGNTTKINVFGELAGGRYAESQWWFYASKGDATVQNYITSGKLYVRGPFGKDTTPISSLKVGNIYCSSTDDSDNKNRIMEIQDRSAYNYTGGTITYLQNSCYFMHSEGTSDRSPILLQVDPSQNINEVYQTGLKKPGIAPFNNATADTSLASAIYGPHSTGSADDVEYLGQTRILNTSNEWTVPALSRNVNTPISYASFEKLICNSNNYRTTAHNITTFTPTALGANDAPKYAIWSFEHNDYDGKPVSIISNPYAAGDFYGVLLYNDTVSSTAVLVGQWSGTTGGSSNDAYIPLELAVPSYTAGSDNLRVTVSAAYSNGGSGSQQNIAIKAHHRDSTQSNNFRVYTSSDTTISSSDPSSPTTATLNLTNVPASGQDDITSVIVGIQLQFASNTNIQKFYITNAAIETY